MKTCIYCGNDKESSEFYVHKGMADGLLSKCKACCRELSAIRLRSKKEDLVWLETERARGRDKYYRLGYRGSHKQSGDGKRKTTKRYAARYPEKIRASILSQHLKAAVKGNQLHHWSYNEEHVKDVIELSTREHKKLHRYIVYDQERKMYRRADNGDLLDTRESHEEFYHTLKYKQ